MFQLKKREKRMDVDAWVQSFLHTMGAIFDDKVIFLFNLIFTRFNKLDISTYSLTKTFTGRNLWGLGWVCEMQKNYPTFFTWNIFLIWPLQTIPYMDWYTIYKLKRLVARKRGSWTLTLIWKLTLYFRMRILYWSSILTKWRSKISIQV